MWLKNKPTPAARLKRRKQGLGVPIHAKISLVLTNMPLPITIHLNNNALFV